MGAIHQQTSVVDGLHHALAQRGQAAFDVMAAIGHAVVAVVGKVNLPHTKVTVQRHHVRLIEQRHRTFKVKPDGEHTIGRSLANVCNAAGQPEALRRGGNFGAKRRQHRHDLRDRIHVHADVDRHIVHAGFAQPVQW